MKVAFQTLLISADVDKARAFIKAAAKRIHCLALGNPGM